MSKSIIDAWSSTLSIWRSNPAWLVHPAETEETPAGGQFIAKRLDSDDGALQYKLYIPSSRNRSPMPLIVMLHGCGQNADDFACGTRMNELAEELQCLVAYPEQSRRANGKNCWNWFDDSNHQRGQGEPALIAAVTRQIIEEYVVDRKRVWVAGLSSGGAMAVILSRTYPDLFAAAGCHSGMAHGSASDLYGALRAMRKGVATAPVTGSRTAASVPIIVFHGDVDFTVHVKNSASVVRQSINSYAAQRSRRGEVAKVALSKQVGRATGRSFTRDIHRGTGGKVVAEQWTVHGAGHAWSGGNGRGSYTDTSGPDASREMMRFFFTAH